MEKSPDDMSFLDHLEELRWRIIRAVIAIMVGALAAFIAKSWVFDKVILAPKHPDFVTYKLLCSLSERLGLQEFFCFDGFVFKLQNISMSGQLTTHLVVSLVAGVIIAFPYVAYQMWQFVKPGLKQKEIRSARGIVFYTSLLFMLGIFFGYFLIAPLSVQFLGGYQVSEEVSNQINLGSFITTVTSVTLSAGLIFQLPVAVYFLAKIGLVTPELLRKYRKHALVGILVIAAIITPPDIMSQVLVTGPVMLLYEISIRVARRIQKRETEKQDPTKE